MLAEAPVTTANASSVGRKSLIGRTLMSKDRGKKRDFKEDDRKTLGERLREAREYLGFSQEEVGTYL